ncbi:MAG TPA: hypothetical protein VEB22_15320 [Phycisphaerales bacterium]|nr:hypothetical protein [Phycisphaerales bacterium]
MPATRLDTDQVWQLACALATRHPPVDDAEWERLLGRAAALAFAVANRKIPIPGHPELKYDTGSGSVEAP